MLIPRIEEAIARYTLKHGKIKKKDIANDIGIKQQYLTEIISGRIKNVDTEVLYKLAKRLECTVDDLYEYKEE